MTSSTFRLPRSIFLVIIVVMTEIILVIAAAVTLFAADLMEVLPIQVFVFIILFKTAVAIIAALVAARTQPIQPRASISRGAGFLLGHFIGWLVGGILGGRLGGWLLAIIGILAGAVLIGQVGAKISYALALQLERLFPSGEQAG